MARNGVCGYKFQIINNGAMGDYDFTVLRAGSEALAAGIVVASVMLAMFWPIKNARSLKFISQILNFCISLSIIKR